TVKLLHLTRKICFRKRQVDYGGTRLTLWRANQDACLQYSPGIEGAQRAQKGTTMASIRNVLIAVVLTAILASAAPTYSHWAEPVNLGAVLNSASMDFGPAISKDGLSLYFNSNRPGGFGAQDIWVSQRASLEAPWGAPMNLGQVINSANGEAVP